ncbi:MAG: hypothetical protein QOE51_1660, partial [Actinoplanes sp.]|nr:hypothetical protein [Actinoplanes sp.]
TNPHTLGIRTPDAFYRFLRGRHGAMVAGHELFTTTTTTTPDAGPAWTAFLTRSFA